MSLDYLTGNVPAQGRVTPLIDGFNYFNDFFDELATLQAGDKVYLLNWYIYSHFYRREDENDGILNTGTEKYLVEILQSLADRGVDVRVMIWVNTSIFNPYYPVPRAVKEIGFQGIPHSRVMESNCRTVHYWRHRGLDNDQEFTRTNEILKNRIIVNTVDAFIGGCHSKFALILRRRTDGLYDGIGYTGGIDFGMNRYGMFWHRALEDHWHDLQVRVEGSEIISEFFYYYKRLWDENIGRKNSGFNPVISLIDEGQHLFIPCIPSAAEPIQEINFHYDPAFNDQYLQSLRTLPDIYPIFQEPEISFAPDGVFEFRRSLEHAIARAETYIYIEDQGMESLEIFEHLADALAQKPQLKIILVTGLTDPGDPPSDNIDKVLLYRFFYSALPEDQRSRLHFLKVGSYVIHSKVYLFDDKLAIVGSAGMFTRSLTEEVEHAVAIVDQGTNEEVKRLREELWAELLQVDPGALADKYPGLGDAMKIWDPGNAEEGLIKLPIYARKFGDFPAEAMEENKNFFFPLLENGAVRMTTFTAAEKQTVRNFPELKEKTVEFGETILATDLSLNVFKQGLLIITSGSEEDNPAYDHAWLPYSGGGLTFGIENPVFTPEKSEHSFEDDRLAFTETDVTLDESGNPVLDKMLVHHDFNLAHQGLIIHCTRGANSGQTRLIKKHEGKRITFDAFNHPIDAGDFNYVLLKPVVGPIYLENFNVDFSVSVAASAVGQFLTREFIFGKFFNQAYTAQMASPMPYGKKAAINEKVRLALNSSSLGEISWEYDGSDGHPQSGTGDEFEMQFTAPGVKTIYAIQQLPGRDPLRYEFKIEVLENSGPGWVNRFPTSKEVADLAEPFRSHVQEFIDAIEEAELPYHIFATLRPSQRAYLMAYAYRVSKGKNPEKIDERLQDVNISWVHYNNEGNVDLHASRAAAQAMVDAYQIGETGAVFPSKHSEGVAIDLKVEIPGPANIKMKSGAVVPLVSQHGLKKVGASYKVKRLRLSNHWSLSGH